MRGKANPPIPTRDFDYQLPEAAIAQHPPPRGESRMLVLDETGPVRHRRIADLPGRLRPGDLLVLNNTRVIRARLFARRRPGGSGGSGPGSAPGVQPGAAVELLLVERLREREWETLARPGRKTKPGTVLDFETGLSAEVVAESPDGRRRVRFSEPVEGHLDRLGHVPLPPYIKRPGSAADRERYQTVFARRPGAIAAPTAGLHFSRELLKEIRELGARIAEITLHVGIGTFRPVTAERVAEHRMERERYEILDSVATAIARTRRAGGRVVAVGTTVVRTLESAADDAVEAGLAEGEILPGASSTELFIVPGHRFRVVDALLTNFHLPRSTLLMLVCAFAGRERVLAAYREALAEGYRFYSYGDAMLLESRSETPR